MTTPGTPSEAAAQASGARSAVLRTGLILGVLAVVFLVILPQFVDYGEIAAAFQALTLPQLALMTVVGAAAWIVGGLLLAVVVTHLSVLRGTACWLIMAGLGASLPYGPWNFAAVWIVLRGWDVPAQRATTGLALYGLINMLGSLAVPLIAAIVLAVVGSLPQHGEGPLVITAVSVAIFLTATGVGLAILESERVAGWVGRAAQATLDGIRIRLGRGSGADVRRTITAFRDEMTEVVRRRGLAAMGVSILLRLAWCLVLIVALRVVGVPGDVLAPSEVLAVHALVGAVMIVPISPGGAGVPELMYIAGLGAIAGASWESDIASAVFLFRIFQWFLPIPLAWILLKLARRGRPLLPTTTELRTFSAGTPV